mmetsp:Transcript_21635/g.38203  ORF Transcript_21635/g.38203 Transcript_21635/m.38203 type:complete len:500 (+) Transcript_21635:69-1568(+)
MDCVAAPRRSSQRVREQVVKAKAERECDEKKLSSSKKRKTAREQSATRAKKRKPAENSAGKQGKEPKTRGKGKGRARAVSAGRVKADPKKPTKGKKNALTKARNGSKLTSKKSGTTKPSAPLAKDSVAPKKRGRPPSSTTAAKKTKGKSTLARPKAKASAKAQLKSKKKPKMTSKDKAKLNQPVITDREEQHDLKMHSDDELEGSHADDNTEKCSEPSTVAGSPKPCKPRRLVAWQRERIAKAPEELSAMVSEFLLNGYTTIKQVLTPGDVEELKNGPSDGECAMNGNEGSFFTNDGRVMRARKGTQLWQGAKKSIQAHIKVKGGTETVLSPLTTREHGRYDMPLPPEALGTLMPKLEQAGVMKLARYLVKCGKIRTQDIMLSMPGSAEQNAHTDSSWAGKAQKDPRTHYVTILIPLSKQDEKTGGTRIWPGSHRDAEQNDWNNYVDLIEPLIAEGDALIFDGLLTHQGMANISKDQSRYFYYAAYANGHDPNTEVTGS